MMSNKYTLNKTLLRCLAKMYKNKGKKARDMGMTKSEFANYTKLKFWGFIDKLDDGLWVVKNSGIDFLHNRIRTAKEITYFRNKVVESEGLVRADEILDSAESKQKYREYMESMNGKFSQL